MYVADTINNVIRTISPKNILGTYSGTGEYGATDGKRRKATWSEPEGLVFGSDGALYVADTGSNAIRVIKKGVVSTIVSTGLRRPSGITLSGSTLFIADTGNNRIVTVSIQGGVPDVLAKNIHAPLKLVVAGKTLYAVSSESGTITSVNLTTKKKRTLCRGLIEPKALTYVNGSLIVAAGASGIWNELWNVNPTSGEKTLLITRRETEWLNQTADIAQAMINGAQRLLLAQQGGSSIFSVDVNGGDLRQIAGKYRFQDEMGVRTSARLGRPKILARSPDAQRLYVSYANSNKIAIVDRTKNQTSVLAGFRMDNYREGIGETARFSDISAMVVSPDGATLYVADRNNQRIRTVNTTTGETGYLTGAGATNLIVPGSTTEQIDLNYDNGYAEGGPCSDVLIKNVTGCAYFNRPMGLALSNDGKTLFVADSSNNRIRKVNTQTGKSSFLAGSGKAGLKDGKGKAASFAGPTALALSRDGKTLYVVDKSNHAIRAITISTARVTTLAGSGKAGYRDGDFAVARFSLPEFLTLDAAGDLLLTESGGQRIRKLSLKTRTVSLVSGSGERGNRNGAAAQARWNNPKGILVLGSLVLVADTKNDSIRLLRR
jgi:sugar lactone lactonase YvrE